ncbi:hypothetical protein PNEG_02092 [Pneumocystis murina B123]|uniref:Uncharacterized protein n=1 Tax=Pneumocystis murina (strain B123) TaxID=1069680 RepID=M7PGC5_PNEMU|nr:hypothetical protein PNEG_02092 [Pneumocystis murina B123]EMR09504.1 hypothetical protein PNEG_02092 [Pneumocystis murina B123]
MIERNLRSHAKRRVEEAPVTENLSKNESNENIKGLGKKVVKQQCTYGVNTKNDSDLNVLKERRGICTRSMETMLVHKQKVSSNYKRSREQKEVQRDLEKSSEKEGLEEENGVKVSKKTNKSNVSVSKQESSRKISAQTVSMINEQLDRILKRLDSNETRFKEQLDHLNESMELLKGKVMEEISNRAEVSPNPHYEPLTQRDISLRTPLFSRDKEGNSPLKTRYSDYSGDSTRNSSFSQKEPYPPSSAMALYKVSRDMRSSPQIHSTKKRQKWTEDEVVALIDLVSIYGPSWAKIKKMDVHGWLQRRTQVDLKDKARVIKQHLLETPDIWHQFVSQCANWEAVSVGHSVGHRGVHSS